MATEKDIEMFLARKREEYEYAKVNNLKTLERVVLEGVKKVIKYHKYEQKPAEQLKLF
jgi:hypothetical protein